MLNTARDKFIRVDAYHEGGVEKAIDIAQNLLDILDDATISLKTGLPLEEVQKLRASQLEQ